MEDNLSREEIRRLLKARKDRLLRTSEVAELLSVSDKTVNRLAADGQFYAFQINDRGHIRISEKSVFSYMDRRDALYEVENGIIGNEFLGTNGTHGTSGIDPRKK